MDTEEEGLARMSRKRKETPTESDNFTLDKRARSWRSDSSSSCSQDSNAHVNNQGSEWIRKANQTILDRNRTYLCGHVDLHRSLLWERLIESSVITSIAADNIKKRYPANSDQVSQLVDHISKDFQRRFPDFVNCLHADEQLAVVDRLKEFDQPAVDNTDLDILKDDIAHHIKRHQSFIDAWPFGNIRNNVSIHHLFTNSKCYRLSRATINSKATLETESDEIFKAIEPSSLVVIQGPSGSGKTTLLKKTVADWALLVKNNGPHIPGSLDQYNARRFEATAGGLHLFNTFEVVIPLNLSCISSETSLEEILREQIWFSQEAYVEKLLRYVSNNQEKVVFCLDALDQFDFASLELVSLIQGKLLPKVAIVIATRPLSDDSKAAVLIRHYEDWFELKGFDRDQRKTYIKKYRNPVRKESVTEADEMWRDIETFGALGLCAVPFYLRLICLMWENGKKWHNKTDLYLKLCGLILQKTRIVSRPFSLQAEETLVRCGCLALTGFLRDRERYVFPIDHDSQEPLDLGLLHKVESRLKRCDLVMFLHPSMQEFLAAYAIVYSESCYEKFIQYINSLERVHDLMEVIMFVFGLSSEVGYKVLEHIVQLSDTRSTNTKAARCPYFNRRSWNNGNADPFCSTISANDLSFFLGQCIRQQSTAEQTDIPLPTKLTLDLCSDTGEQLFAVLSKKRKPCYIRDLTIKTQLLTSTHQKAIFTSIVLKDLQCLTLEAERIENAADFGMFLKHMTSLVSLRLDLSVSTETDADSILYNLKCPEKLIQLDMTGLNLSNSGYRQLQSVLSRMKKLELLTSVGISLSRLGRDIDAALSSVSLMHLSLQEAHLTEYQVKILSETLVNKCCRIQSLDLSENNLSVSIVSVAWAVSRLSNLRILKLQNCQISADGSVNLIQKLSVAGSVEYIDLRFNVIHSFIGQLCNLQEVFKSVRFLLLGNHRAPSLAVVNVSGVLTRVCPKLRVITCSQELDTYSEDIAKMLTSLPIV